MFDVTVYKTKDQTQHELIIPFLRPDACADDANESELTLRLVQDDEGTLFEMFSPYSFTVTNIDHEKAKAFLELAAEFFNDQSTQCPELTDENTL